jgi:group I intron endonuclease
LNKYGQESFEFKIIEYVSQDKLIETEQRYLDEAIKEKDKCYNQNFLAERGSFSEEVIRKRVNSIRKYYSTHPNPMTGKTHSVETREKIRQKVTGRKLSKDTKKKLGEYTGIKNGFSDKTIYSLFNQKTGEVFQGLRSDFSKKYNVSSSLFTWAMKKHKPCKGWIVKSFQKSLPFFPVENPAPLPL